MANKPQRETGVLKDTHPQTASVIKKKELCTTALWWEFQNRRRAIHSKCLFNTFLKLFICLWCVGITHPAQTHVVTALLQIQGLQKLLYSLSKCIHAHKHTFSLSKGGSSGATDTTTIERSTVPPYLSCLITTVHFFSSSLTLDFVLKPSWDAKEKIQQTNYNLPPKIHLHLVYSSWSPVFLDLVAGLNTHIPCRVTPTQTLEPPLSLFSLCILSVYCCPSLFSLLETPLWKTTSRLHQERFATNTEGLLFASVSTETQLQHTDTGERSYIHPYPHSLPCFLISLQKETSVFFSTTLQLVFLS